MLKPHEQQDVLLRYLATHRKVHKDVIFYDLKISPSVILECTLNEKIHLAGDYYILDYITSMSIKPYTKLKKKLRKKVSVKPYQASNTPMQDIISGILIVFFFVSSMVVLYVLNRLAPANFPAIPVNSSTVPLVTPVPNQ